MINGANMKRTTTTQAIVIFAVLLSSTKIIVGSQIITYSELFVSKKKDFNKKVTTDNRGRGTKIAWSDSEVRTLIFTKHHFYLFHETALNFEF